jgi:hypothetical protein
MPASGAAPVLTCAVKRETQAAGALQRAAKVCCPRNGNAGAFAPRQARISARKVEAPVARRRAASVHFQLAGTQADAFFENDLS